MKKLRMAAAIAALALTLAAGACLLVIWKYADRQEVPDGVSVGRIAIGGMPIEEALDLLDRYEQALLERSITVESGNSADGAAGESASNNADGAASDRTRDNSSGRVNWTAAELGYRSEFGEAKAALRKLRQGGVFERARYRYHFPKHFEITQSWSRDAFDAAVRKQWSWMEAQEPTDATRTITDDDKVLYTPHSDAYRIDWEGLVTKAENWILLDGRQLGEQLGEGQKHLSLELPITVIHPSVTLEKLKAEGVERKIMSFTTDFATSAEGRAHNVTVTAETLHDWHLAPGEVFAYSQLIALTEERHKYREAPVILNGKLVPGIGGGICQVSSTLYQAVLRSGLEIVERRNHSLPVAYMPLGYDATYATDAIDFKFRNSTGKHLIIRTEVKDRKLTVKLLGSMPEDERYDIESVTVQTVDPQVQQNINPALPIGASVVIDQGKPGYVVETYRTLVKNGEAVSRERVSRDTYRAQPVIIERGPDSPNATPSPGSNDGSNNGSSGNSSNNGNSPSPEEVLLEDGV